MRPSAGLPGLFLCILFVICVFSAGADEPRAVYLTEEASVEMALLNNPAIRSELISLKIAENSHNNRWNIFLPSLTGTSTLLRLNIAPVNPIPGGADPPRWNLGAGLDTQLTLSVAMKHRVEALKLALKGAGREVESVIRETEISVRKSFYQLLLQKEQISLMEQRISAADKRYQEASEDYSRGVIDEYTLLTLQVALENLKPALKRMENGYNLSLLRFKQTLGIPQETMIVLIGKIEAPDFPVLGRSDISSLISSSPALQKTRLGLEQLENTIRMTRAGLYPTVTFRLGFDPALGGDPFTGDIFDADLWKQRSGAFSATLRLPLEQFLPGSPTRTEIRNLNYKKEQMEIALRQAEEALELQVLALLGELASSLETLGSLQLNAELAERAYILAQEGYSFGLRTIAQVRDSEIDMSNARLELLKEQHRYREALLDLQHLLSVPLEILKEN